MAFQKIQNAKEKEQAKVDKLRATGMGFHTPNNLFTVDFAVITAAALSAGRFLPDCKPSTILVAVAVPI